jgi:endonuclease/exonuclease/phosphatase family metal-dependent hydrolase
MPSSASFELKVMTINTHKGFSSFNRKFILPALREGIRQVEADVVFLQEITGVHTRHASRVQDWPVASHYEFLADTIWPQYAYGRNAVYPAGDHGNAILSKYPIERHVNHDVSIAGPERRGLLHCELRVPGYAKPVHVICAHLGLAELHRRRQMEILCRIIDEDIPVDAPVIVAGDFNDWRRRGHSILKHGANLDEVYASAHGRSAKTFPARFPLLALDRIYVRNVVAHQPALLPKKPWSSLSDHAPLAARITL